jgi:hypothetical protein
MMTPPPGYTGYDAGRARGPAAPILGLTKWLAGLLVASIVAGLASIAIQAGVRSDARDFLDGEISSAEFDDNLATYLSIGLLAGALGIALLVVLCIWTFRIGKNMRDSLSRQGMTFSNPGATIAINILGGFTLGILNYLMWREIWSGSDPDSPAGDIGWKKRAVAVIVHAWFAVTLIAAVVGLAAGVRSLAGGFGRNSENIAEQLDNVGTFLIAPLLSLVSSALMVLIVRQVAARHAALTGEAR